MNRNSDLVRARTEDGRELTVGRSFAERHGLELIGADETPQTPEPDLSWPAPVDTSQSNYTEGSDSSASHTEE